MVVSKKLLVFVALTALLCQPLYAGSGSAPRLVPLGSVKFLETGVEMDREIPAPSGALMACTGQCYVETAGLQLMGADGTVFAVQEGSDLYSVVVQKGSLDFALNKDANPVEFHTPFDTLNAKPYLLPAGGDAVIRGNLNVTEDRAVLTLAQGSLQLSNSRGQTLLHAGNALTMAQLPYKTGSTKKSRDMHDTLTGWAVGAGAVGIIGASIAALSSGGGDGGGDGGDGGNDVSPSRPK